MRLKILLFLTVIYILTNNIMCYADCMGRIDFLKTGISVVDLLSEEQAIYINAYSNLHYKEKLYELNNEQLQELSQKIFIFMKGRIRIKTIEELELNMSVREKNLIDYYINKDKIKNMPYEKRMYLSQYDERWSEHRYGTSSISVSGCATACLAMMLNIVADSRIFYPDYIAEWADNSEYQYYIPDYGTSWKLLEDYPWKYGLRAEQFSINSVNELLQIPENTPVILAMTRGIFTDDGHFIVVMRMGNTFLVLDPANIERTLKIWDAYELFSQMRGIAWKYTGRISGIDEVVKRSAKREIPANEQKFYIASFKFHYDENEDELFKTRAAIYNLLRYNRKG